MNSAFARGTDLRALSAQAPAVPFTFRGRRPTSGPASTSKPAASTPSPSVMAGKSRFRADNRIMPAPSRPNTDPAVVDGIAIHPRVVLLAQDRGATLDSIAAAVLAPEESWPGKNNRSTVCLRGDVAAITADDSGEVIAISSRTSALKARTEPRDGSIHRSSGGSGKAFPTSVSDLLARLDHHDFEVDRDGNHYIVSHRSRPGQVAVPKTPSDYRSIPNTVLEIRGRFGIDVRESA